MCIAGDGYPKNSTGENENNLQEQRGETPELSDFDNDVQTHDILPSIYKFGHVICLKDH